MKRTGPVPCRRNPVSSKVPIPVVCAVIEREGRVLLAQRPDHKHLPRKWEFAGGKVEPGETPAQAAVRVNSLLEEATGAKGQVFFCNSGAEANEAALKLARKFGGRGRHVAPLGRAPHPGCKAAPGLRTSQCR
mgnify:CR=1 FL=1